MISAAFFNKSIDANCTYLFDEIVLRYLAAVCINKKMDASEAIVYIEKIYGQDALNHRKFKTLYLGWISDFNGILLDSLNNIEKFKEDFFLHEWDSEEDLFNLLHQYIGQQPFNIKSALPIIFSLDKKRTRKSDLFYEATYCFIVSNENALYSMLDAIVDSINDSYSNASLKHIISNRLIVEILFSNGFYVVKDLNSLNINSLIVLLSLDFDDTLNSLKSLNNDYSVNLKENVEDVYATLSEKSLEIIAARNGFYDSPMTLEEVGQKYGVTRERIRQVEKKSEIEIKRRAKKVSNQVISLFYHLAGDNAKYVAIEKMKAFLNDDDLSAKLLHIIEISDLCIKYDDQISVLFNIDLATPEEFANEIMNVFGDVIDIDAIKYLDESEQKVIKLYYREYKNSVYLRKGLSGSDLVASVIDTILPNGYKIDDENNYAVLNEEIHKRYGDDFDIGSRRALDARIMGRDDFCLIDRGLYKRKSLCVTLPDELQTLIINYISCHSPLVHYDTIFQHFKEELKAVGINNKYYLKGLIDPVLPQQFKHGKISIQTSQEKVTSSEAIRMHLRSFNGVFSIEDVRNKFKGVPDYTFFNVIYPEMNNGLLQMPNLKFVYAEKLSLSESDICKIKSEIESTFELLKEDTISCRKVFARIALTNKELLKNLTVIQDHFSFFSLIKYLFSKDYGFNRPLISKDPNNKIDSTSVIMNYAKKLDSFNSRTINNYVTKMNMRGLYSYLSFMENMSEDFVQINMDSMISKKKFAISNDALTELKSLLNLVITKNGCLNTNSFNGYFMFPKIEYHWNKYLLVGIIRSFLDNEFDIEDTDTSYDTTDFIIRRVD